MRGVSFPVIIANLPIRLTTLFLIPTAGARFMDCPPGSIMFHCKRLDFR